MSTSKTATLRSKARTKSKRAATFERDGFGVITVTMKGKPGGVIVVRSSRTGRFTSGKSAHVIDKGVERFAGTLKRLAKK